MRVVKILIISSRPVGQNSDFLLLRQFQNLDLLLLRQCFCFKFSFKTNPNFLSVRLRGSDVQGSGRVEVYYNGTWGTVCDNSWDIRDADVVCRMLGYTHALQATCCGKYGKGKGKIWLEGVTCTGEETNLFNCTHRGWGKNRCRHREDAGVMCANTTGKKIYFIYRQKIACNKVFVVVN